MLINIAMPMIFISLFLKRKWMIVDENGSFKTQRQYPKMALIELSIDGEYFILNANWSKKGPLKVAISPIGLSIKKCRLQLFIYLLFE